MTKAIQSGWKLSWYTASARVGSGARVLPLDVLEKALRAGELSESRSLEVEPASSSEARVTIVTRARHSGAACERLLDLLAHSAPRGWLWEQAAVRAELTVEGNRRWPRLAVLPDKEEAACEHAAMVLAGWAADPSSAEVTGAERAAALEVLSMCGLTLSAGQEPGGPGGELHGVEP